MTTFLFAAALAFAEPSPPPATEPKATSLTACFSPDEDCAARLAEFIASAKTSVDVAIYDINEVRIVHQIAAQGLRIPVRIVVDQRQSKGSHSSVAELKTRKGVELRYGRQRGIFHDKFVIVDGQAVETGSFNFTNHATQANQENQVYLNDPKIAAAFHERFEKIWATARAEPAAPRVTKVRVLHEKKPRRPASTRYRWNGPNHKIDPH